MQLIAMLYICLSELIAMRVVIEVFALLREKLGWASKVVELEGSEAKLIDVLRKVPELYNLVVKESEGSIAEGFIVMINGVHAQFRGGLEAVVRDGDTISVFPPAAGG